MTAGSPADPAKPRKPTAKSLPASEHVCSFCKKDFRSLDVLIVHLCEQKRRFNMRDDKHVKMGFIAYQKFFEKSLHRKKLPSYEQFAASKYYAAFVKFGRYLQDIYAINALGFVEFLCRHEVPLADWQRPDKYETYMREWTITEQPVQAITRNFKLMETWAMDADAHWTDFFQAVAPSLAILWIKSGRLSPWLLFTAHHARDLFDRFTPEQNRIFHESIDLNFWKLKMQRHSAEVAEIRGILLEAGI